ncbi:hypothetical protein RN001_013595 [Aquatica leii]|uniref:Uncharacterized protein n=1 Tax=Aquatica leii TaxID=1421715 RepID=A0AAN7PZZ6_9COLE|nr:hypothetical protein RN001_013595 [Aquatica leii]
MNVDGMFGVVVAQAHLQTLRTPDSKPRFEYLTNLASYLVNHFKGNHSNASSRNDMFMKYLLNVNIWTREITFIYGQLHGKSYVDYSTCGEYLDSLANMHFSEELSDDCLLGVIEQSLSEKHLCWLDEECSDFLSGNKFLPGYGLTHKLLLVQTIRARKCKWDAFKIHRRVVEFCSKIHRETVKIQNCKYVSFLDDLFIEQIVMCGYEGFEEFMTTEWMEHVLKIQSPHGCFGTSTSSSVFEKREANLIKHNCIDHTSGLGAAALSLFLRFLTVSGKGGKFVIVDGYGNHTNQTVIKHV